MTTKSLIACLTLLWSVPILGLTAESAVPERSSNRITIHVYNYSAMSSKELASAKEQVYWIFKQAGLAVTWIDVDLNGGGDCTYCWNETHFVLRLLNQARPGNSPDAAGETLHPPRIANVFLDRVTSQSKKSKISIGQLLAYVLAHELGHLLLGPNAHGNYGIMVSDWSKQDMLRMSRGDLRFTPREIQQMQAKLKRVSLSSAVEVARVP